MVAYSNSSYDITLDGHAREKDEKAVRSMYEYSPYPDLGADLKSLDLYLNPLKDEIKSKKDITFLDVGCGTGHIIVGVAKKCPSWKCVGIDLSNASLNIAKALAEKHNVTNIEFRRASYLDPLPEHEKFDIISAIGTIHHCADPVGAMKNLKQHLKDDGTMLLHMYGYRCDREKFDIKNMLNILEPDLTKYEKRFELYQALMKHRKGRWLKRLATTSPYDVYLNSKNWLRNIKRRMNKVSWSPGWDANYTELNSPWIDHFCHPCERAYEVSEIQELLDASGFKATHMLKQGREFPHLIPKEWKDRYNRLSDCDKWKISEAISSGGGSFAMILKKE